MKYEKIPRYLVARTTLMDYSVKKLVKRGGTGVLLVSCLSPRPKKKNSRDDSLLYSNLSRDWSLQINAINSFPNIRSLANSIVSSSSSSFVSFVVVVETIDKKLLKKSFDSQKRKKKKEHRRAR